MQHSHFLINHGENDRVSYIIQRQRKNSKIVCAIHIIKSKYWVCKIYTLLTHGPNIGCANVHPASSCDFNLPMVVTLTVDAAFSKVYSKSCLLHC